MRVMQVIWSVVEFLPCLNNPEDMYRALHWAAEKGRSSIVELIIRQPGIDVNAKVQGDTALLLACKSADLSTIQVLIKAGADSTVVYETVKAYRGFILSSDPSTANLQNQTAFSNDRGYTALHALCKNSVYGEKARSEATECVKALLQAGADVHAKDSKGFTALHYAFQSSIGWMKPLLDAGADPTMEDDDGDTVLHLLSSFESEAVSLVLKNEKVDINKAREKDGMTPLLCRLAENKTDDTEIIKSLAYKPDVNLTDLKGDGPLHLALRRWAIQPGSKFPTVRDHEGIQPLHIAATISETFVYKLFNVGADIGAATNDKMTVLHLATRARQSGIIDMILSRANSLSAETCFNFVNTQDEDGRTALHYACRSGRPETVKSLLEAGAALDVLDIHKHSPLTMCGECEKEALLWDRHMPSSNPRRQLSEIGLNATGLTLKDDTRPFFDRADDDTAPPFGMIKSEHDTTRLTQIINLLVKHGVDLESGEESLKYAWRYAAQPEYGHTLVFHPCQIGLPNPNYRKALKETLETNAKAEEGKEQKGGPHHATSLRHRSAEKALALRYYDLFENLSGGRESLHVPDYNGHTSLNMLARCGFVDILDSVCTKETAAQLDGFGWTTNPNEDDLKCRIPLVISACERQLPNMDVLKLIVEDFGVNVNAKRTQRIYRDRRYRPTICDGVLHDLSIGRFWWHVNEALPYLIRMGADINIRNREGQTPLIAALKSHHPFSKEASEILIRAGAYVNAVDTESNTCLSIVGDNMDMTKLLLTHGAEISPTAFLSTLKLKKVDLLETLLSQSGSSIVNQPLPNESSRTNPLGSFTTVGVGALPLLFTAACENFKENINMRKQLMEVLLKHGADPYSTFQQQKYQVRNWSSEKEPKVFPATSATLMHELLSGGHIVDPIFNLPPLDLERRDENGCTLILAASKAHRQGNFIGNTNQKVNTIDPLSEMIKRGANVMAQDNKGRTILHHVVNDHSRNLNHARLFREALQGTVATSPGLVHQTHNNNETALHYALRGGRIEFIEFLLENGADPLQPEKNGDMALHRLVSFDYKSTKDIKKRAIAC
ncbi:hypothetical protein N7478_003844 [Penicillium angulare]|uniref:uncharacterized protein n=1 Tax=Penicillium angulare TaxID=116970 RepID=UPI0025421DB5|nr:uncharacterized protein N7478_003844 [Penicillium angulare]KAJ5288158.1 hypothetical protein N7478_003844 [Penicillium angulare]